MKKLLLTFILGILLINIVSSQIDLGVIKQNECTELYQSCPTCTYSDIRAIKYPNGTIETMDIEMTKVNSDFTYEFCNTNSIGTYTYTVYGNKGGLSYESSEEGIFEVNSSGFKNTLGFYILILVLSLGIVIFGISLSDAPITILGSFGLYFLGLWILFNGIDNLKDPTYTWAIGLIVLGLAMYISFKSAYELIID